MFSVCEEVSLHSSKSEGLTRKALKRTALFLSQNRIETDNPWNRALALHFVYEECMRERSLNSISIAPTQQIQMDSLDPGEQRLKQFSFYFQKLSARERFLLVAKETIGLPWEEIASALQTPIASLHVERSLALKRLQFWIWDSDEGDSYPILKTLENLPRKNLPLRFRQGTKHLRLPTISWSSFFSDLFGEWTEPKRWMLEAGIVVLILYSVLQAGPKITQWQKDQMHRRITAWVSQEDFTDPGLPLTRGKVIEITPTEEDQTEDHEEFSEESDEEPVASPIVVASGEIWRFILKTESPLQSRSRILEYFKERAIQMSDPAHSGVEAPGGIQFDIDIPIAEVLKLKQFLSLLSATPLDAATSSSDSFTWYKTRSKQPIERGKARIVIWLSQI